MVALKAASALLVGLAVLAGGVVAYAQTHGQTHGQTKGSTFSVSVHVDDACSIDVAPSVSPTAAVSARCSSGTGAAATVGTDGRVQLGASAAGHGPVHVSTAFAGAAQTSDHRSRRLEVVTVVF